MAELKEKGATALGDAELKALIVDKTLKAKNSVTGQEFEILYGSDGQRVITSVDGREPMPTDVLTRLHGGQFAVSAKYEIKQGSIVTTLDGSPFVVTVYKNGDQYVAARSSEFGYANYDVLSVTGPAAR